MGGDDADSQPGAQRVLIIYDGDCEFCSAYAKFLRLQEAAGPVELLSARADDARISACVQQGYDLNEGMLVITGSEVHAGADAMRWLALNGPRDTLGRRLHALIFGTRWCSRALYPWLKLGRRVWLAARGRSRIRA